MIETTAATHTLIVTSPTRAAARRCAARAWRRCGLVVDEARVKMKRIERTPFGDRWECTLKEREEAQR